MAKTHRTTSPTILVCTECGNKQSIRRIKGRMRAQGHIKHYWCIKCKERTAHEDMGGEEGWQSMMSG